MQEIEYLDIYAENRAYLGKEDRRVVHETGAWHKTVHCWLYDSLGNVYFQIRSDKKRGYTTASGHLQAGETINDAFEREIKEEIGIDIDTSKLKFIREVTWIMDKEEKNYHDHAWANICICLYEGNDNDFDFSNDEVDGIIKCNAKDALKLFECKVSEIDAVIIKDIAEKKKVTINDFVVMENETALTKYGFILEAIIEEVK